MNHHPSIYKFNTSSIRVVYRDGEPWFVAKDISDALEYNWKGTSGTIKHVPEVWRGVLSVQTPSGEQEMAVLSEAGMFFFLNRSDKPKALPFQMWLAGDVLPSIRKTGSYTAVPSQADQSIALNASEEEIGQLRDEVAALKDELLDLYRMKAPMRKVVEKVVYRVPVEAIELMAKHGVPREQIASVSGRTRGCVRVHIHKARKSGRLS